jgi:HEPN domain-containing protein
MFDIQKQIEYWKLSAREDWEVARNLVHDNKTRHGLFFAHLAIEKALKAHVCRSTRTLSPRIHNLVRLSELAGLDVGPERLDVLADMNQFNVEGRYPEMLQAPSLEESEEYIMRAEEVLQWLLKQL